MKFSNWLFSLLVIGIILWGCKTEVDPVQEAVQGIDLSLMDTTVTPGADFYQFVNGNWLANVEIPADRGVWNGFSELRKKTDQNVLEVLTGAMKGDTYQPGSDQAKAANFFQTAMDTAQINRVGLAPL